MTGALRSAYDQFLFKEPPMILYGSQTSPFVRRLRLLLPEQAYEFREVNIFNPVERNELRKISPLLKIPILQEGEKTVWDSRIIFYELVRQGYHSPLSLDEENLLTAINDVSDSLIQGLLAQRSGLIIPPDSPLGTSHQERILNTLTYFENNSFVEKTQDWNFVGMCLYCLIDWIEFRNLTDLKRYPKLLAYREAQRERPRVTLTDPRNS
jgi:glutathione S-transferase